MPWVRTTPQVPSDSTRHPAAQIAGQRGELGGGEAVGAVRRQSPRRAVEIQSEVAQPRGQR